MSGIDIVYLWVDGADPAWRTRRQCAYAAWVQAHPGQLALHGNVAGRYRDNGELRYNLRALERFFPGHGHIYLLTDRQVPHWLRVSPRLTVIDHASLMPDASLPVFDSGHIESYLHHIPGLSERFLYLNDDVFFGAPFEPAFWFGEEGEGRLSVFTESALQPDLQGLRADVAAPVNCATLSRQWLSAHYADYRHEPRLYAHAPRPMLKSALHELEGLAPAMFAGVRDGVPLLAGAGIAARPGAALDGASWAGAFAHARPAAYRQRRCGCAAAARGAGGTFRPFAVFLYQRYLRRGRR
ncbi:MAG: stealth family protein [Janthinobacterium sp.]